MWAAQIHTFDVDVDVDECVDIDDVDMEMLQMMCMWIYICPESFEHGQQCVPLDIGRHH